jgi:cytochrome c peroxidase
MAMPDQATVVERLKADERYPRQFAAAFQTQSDPVTFDNVTLAVAAFERTLITHDRLDDFLKGRDNALNPAELKGLNTFLTTGCTTCHNGPLLGGNSFRKFGIFQPYKNQGDHGMGAIVKGDDDFDPNFLFKVPSLRNIAATAPYFHDGGSATLPETVRAMAKMQLAVDLTQEQEQELVVFLQCLTDKGIKSETTAVKQTSATTAKLPVESAQNVGRQ